MVEVARGSVGLDIDKAGFVKQIEDASALGSTSLTNTFRKLLTGGGPAADFARIGVTIGATLLDVGEHFQSAFNTIAQKTGATGAALKGLESDFKAVFATTPGATFQNVADALSEVSVRTHLAGAPLDDLTAKFVELGKITKTDVGADVSQATSLLNLFGVAAKDQSGQLDVLFKASQDAGVGIGDFMGAMQTAAPTAQALGLNVDQTAAIVDKLTRLGLPAQRVMMGLGMEFGKAAKAGKDPTAVIGEMVDTIQKAPNATAAMTLAMKDFGIGARQASVLVDAIRAGTFNFGETLGQITNGQGGIKATTEATMTMGDRFKLLKNDVLTAMEPAAAKVLEFADVFAEKLPGAFDKAKAALGPLFQALGTGFTGGSTAGLSGFAADLAAVGETAKTVFDFFQTDGPPAIAATGSALSEARDGFAVVVSFVQADVIPALSRMVSWLQNDLPAALGRLKTFFQPLLDLGKPLLATFVSLFAALAVIFKVAFEIIAGVVVAAVVVLMDLWDRFGSHLIDHLKTALDAIAQMIRGALEILKGIFDLIHDLLTGKWGKLWGDIEEILAGAWNLIIGALKFAINEVSTVIGVGMAAVSEVWSGIWAAMKDVVGAVFGGIGSVISSIFDGIVSTITGAINLVISAIDDIIKAYNDIPGLLRPTDKIGLIPLLGGQPSVAAPSPSTHAGGAIGANAAGTDFWTGGLSWVGENGPELLNLPRGGQVLSHDELLQAAASVVPGSSSGGAGALAPLSIENLNVTNTQPEMLATDIVRELRGQAFLVGGR